MAKNKIKNITGYGPEIELVLIGGYLPYIWLGNDSNYGYINSRSIKKLRRFCDTILRSKKPKRRQKMDDFVNPGQQECRKCGFQHVSIKYLPSTNISGMSFPEYLEIKCNTCGFRWDTFTKESVPKKEFR